MQQFPALLGAQFMGQGYDILAGKLGVDTVFLFPAENI
jgi:hypothetical protein